jgi:peptidoglycan/LPS O-acetylase OafA/YrhL
LKVNVATSRLQEIPEKNRNVHITALDGWRGIACLLVLFYHTGSNIFFPPLVIYGFIGLHLFFVLSGYLISSPFLKAIRGRSALPSTGRFYMRRLIRIYPPYLVSPCLPPCGI